MESLNYGDASIEDFERRNMQLDFVALLKVRMCGPSSEMFLLKRKLFMHYHRVAL